MNLDPKHYVIKVVDMCVRKDVQKWRKGLLGTVDSDDAHLCYLFVFFNRQDRTNVGSGFAGFCNRMRRIRMNSKPQELTGDPQARGSSIRWLVGAAQTTAKPSSTLLAIWTFRRSGILDTGATTCS
jgi:hypothetical protein